MPTQATAEASNTIFTLQPARGEPGSQVVMDWFCFTWLNGGTPAVNVRVEGTVQTSGGSLDTAYMLGAKTSAAAATVGRDSIFQNFGPLGMRFGTKNLSDTCVLTATCDQTVTGALIMGFHYE
jgi:hypothetical protein